METGLFDYLETLKGIDLDRLYHCPWSCQGVLQSLPKLAKQYVFRVVSINKSLEKNKFRSWVHKSETSAHDTAMQKLLALRVLVETSENDLNGDGDTMMVDSNGGMQTVAVNPIFREQIKKTLHQGVVLPWQHLPSGKRLSASKVPEDFEESAREHWNVLLHFIVGSKDNDTEEFKLTSNIVQLLIDMGLMKYQTQHSRVKPVLTNLGYEFLLLDIHQQIWSLMKFYTENSSSPDDVLQFLFRMSFCKPGTMCCKEALTDGQINLLQDFRSFGLIYYRNLESRRFYPTSLGVNIVFGASREERLAKENSEGNKISNLDVIVETNFKVYAYTESTLHKKMLDLFVDIETVLPNMVVGVIKRNSVREAFKKGISAKQLINFLLENAHPKCKNRSIIVPDNVTDQIYLWEEERSRMKKSMVYMYSNFYDEAEYEKVERYAKDLGILKFSCKENKRVIVEEQHHNTIKEYLKRLR